MLSVHLDQNLAVVIQLLKDLQSLLEVALGQPSGVSITGPWQDRIELYQ